VFQARNELLLPVGDRVRNASFQFPDVHSKYLGKYIVYDIIVEGREFPGSSTHE
jgi:hypothetical protein